MKLLSSDFALLDVRVGRKGLAKRIEAGEQIPVTIRGTITRVWGNDDGTSIEFEVTVSKAEIRK